MLGRDGGGDRLQWPVLPARSGPWTASGKAVGPSLASQQVSAGWVSAQGQGGVGMDTESSSGRESSLTPGHCHP